MKAFFETDEFCSFQTQKINKAFLFPPRPHPLNNLRPMSEFPLLLSLNQGGGWGELGRGLRVRKASEAGVGEGD